VRSLAPVSPLRRRRGGDDRSIPAHPYRDAVLVYGFMAIVLVAVAVATGGEPLRASLAALGFFVLATGWSWWRFRVRIKARAAARAAASGGVSGSGARGPANGNGNVNGRGETP
jgi:hypothetical protein